MSAIDLYSGIGGWTLGFKMAGIDVISSYEWWKDANNTHNKNFGTAHRERNIRELDLLTDLPDPKDVKYVIGSPPCTQFSYANRGGNGDIADGLVDIHKFLEVVEYLQPQYWAMENVPRVANILRKEIEPGGSLHKFKHLFNGISVYDSADFGVPQNRKRMIAGRLPFDLLESYKTVTPQINMGDVLDALNQDPVIDPVYGIHLAQENLMDHAPESPLNEEEARMNGDAKSYHPVYNKMSFPDRWDRPSRTVTALCTRVSRESIVIKDHKNKLRRLTVRERGCIQSFPINFQFYSKSYGGKLKMIGNAVPPVLTFYIAQSMLERKASEILFPNQVPEKIVVAQELPAIHESDKGGSKYSWSRSFWLAIRGLRFGSGVRFELRNQHDKQLKSTEWRVNLFYGNSKNIRSKQLDYSLFQATFGVIETVEIQGIESVLESFVKAIEEIDVSGLQKHWTNQDRDAMGPIQLIDSIASYVSLILEKINDQKIEDSLKLFIEEELKSVESTASKKLIQNSKEVFTGMLLGSCFNSLMEGKRIQLKLPITA